MPGSIACWRWASAEPCPRLSPRASWARPLPAGWAVLPDSGLTKGSCCWVSFAWSRCSLSWPGCCGPGGLPLRSWLRFSCMPFWVDIFHDYYLPDLLHAAILAAILLCLLFGHIGSAMVLLFPAYLARESTVLVAICLVFACWRRIRLRFAVIGVLALLCAGLVSRHYGQSGPASVHGLSGVTYILGKLFWSFFKIYSRGLPLGVTRSRSAPRSGLLRCPRGVSSRALDGAIGLCQPALAGSARLILAWFGVFGIGPAPGAGCVAGDGRPSAQRRPGTSSSASVSCMGSSAS